MHQAEPASFRDVPRDARAVETGVILRHKASLEALDAAVQFRCRCGPHEVELAVARVEAALVEERMAREAWMRFMAHTALRSRS